MSIWQRLSRQTLDLLITLVVRERSTPTAAAPPKVGHCRISTVYLLPYRSAIDLLSLQRHCLSRQWPDPLEIERLEGQSSPRYLFLNRGAAPWDPPQLDPASVAALQQRLQFLQCHPAVEMQLVPICLMWGRSPGYGTGLQQRPCWRWLTPLRKFFSVLTFGRDLFIHLAPPIALRTLLQRGNATAPALQKWARFARWQLARQYFMVAGPPLPKRAQLLQRCLQAPPLQAALTTAAPHKQKSAPLIEQQLRGLLNEMAAHFSYPFIRGADRLFSWLWKHLYQGIEVNHIEPIRQAALTGQEIVYLPCHRSHMDYLLLSYVLYHQGLMPPHIAAGINLNFWPVGALFRRSGAFFIRRSIQGNKLYSMALRSYLAQLFELGCPVEYFIEGGRSRTGRLLAPKTGLLSMTLQAVLEGSRRPMVLVPVYISYEHVLEAPTYAEELAGSVKQHETIWQLFSSLKALRHLGRSTVNFGEPIPLQSYLKQQGAAEQPATSLGNPAPRLPGLPTLVNALAQKIMMAINSAAAVNAVNLCVTLLLVAPKHCLPYLQLARQLTCYLQLLRQAPYSRHSTLPTQPAAELIAQAIKLGKLQRLSADPSDSLITLPAPSVAELSYYRHNIQHLLVLPSLMANLILQQPGISATALVQAITLLYPVLQVDLFIDYAHPALDQRVTTMLQAFSRQQLIQCQGAGYWPKPANVALLQPLAANTQELLQRYLLILKLLLRYPQWSRRTVETRVAEITQALSGAATSRAWGRFDKGSTVIPSLQAQGSPLLTLLETLLPSERMVTINTLVEQVG